MIDHALPRWQFDESHQTVIRAPRAIVWDALMRVTIDEIALMRQMFWLRSLPPRLLGQSQPLTVESGPILDLALNGGFVRVAEEPGRQIVLGVVGQFWRPSSGVVRLADGAAFQAFDIPGYARAAMDFKLEDLPDGRTRLRTETRVDVPSTAARRLFAAYWLLVRPGSGLLRRTWLRAIKRRAERAGPRLSS